MYIQISGWHSFDFRSVCSLIDTGWQRWHCGRTWCQLWCRLSESVMLRCNRAFAAPLCLRILCCVSGARQDTLLLSFTKNSEVYFRPNLQILMLRKLNSPCLLFLDISTSLYDQVLHFLYCCVQKLSLAILAIFNPKSILDCSSCT